MPNIKEILIASNAKEKLHLIQKAKLVTNSGIVGDRYYSNTGSFSKLLKEKNDYHITFIEQEEINDFNQLTGLNYPNHIFRRNIVTKNIKLNDLVGKRFYINEVEFLGMRLCEPCKMLANEIGKEFLEKMIHKSGLRARILTDGEIKIGDTIQCL